MPHARGEDRGVRAALHPTMAFDGDTLVLGAGTALAVADRRLFLTQRDGEAFDEARVAALLAVACGRAITPSELRYVREALRRRSEGETTLALTHLALANLPKLNPPEEAAWRLSAADGLLKDGMSPATMLSALGLAPANASPLERAYNPDQPRVPAGNGETSGQWTKEDDGGGADESPAPSQSDGGTEPAGVQVASNSDDWAQYLNPAGSAEAAEAGASAARNGVTPNIQHSLGVARAIEIYGELGYEIERDKATAVLIPGFATPRVYDFIARDPVSNDLIGVEVKTTFFDTVYLDRDQVDKDVSIYLGNVATFRDDPNKIVTQVAY